MENETKIEDPNNLENDIEQREKTHTQNNEEKKIWKYISREKMFTHTEARTERAFDFSPSYVLLYYFLHIYIYRCIHF